MKQGDPLESRVRELTASEVRRDFLSEYEKLGYNTTENVEPLDGFIGLERAEEAARDGLDMQKPGWNIFVRYGTVGRHSFVDTILNEHGDAPQGLQDICLVHSFEPEKCDSNVLYLEPGRGKQLKQDVANLIKWLQEEIPLLTQSPQYVEFEQNLRLADVAENQALMDKLKGMGLGLGQSNYGTPVVYALDKEDPEGGKKELKGAEIVTSYLRDQIKGDQDAASAKKQLIVELASADVDKMVSEMKARYGNDDVSCWLDKVGRDALANLDNFLVIDQPGAKSVSQQQKRTDLLLEPKFRRYEVNVQVDHSDTPLDKPLVITEDKPTRSKLGGKRKVYSTSLTTEMEFDHMSVDLGSLVKAKGGYFVVDIEDLLVKHGSWDVLKNILDAGELKLGETFMGLLGFEVEAPKIEGIDISDVKVILVGEQLLDHYVQSFYLDKKFLNERFKVNVDFEPDTKVDDDQGVNIGKVAQFVRKICDKADLLHFDRTGLSAAAEHLVRMAGSKEKFSLQLGGAGGLSDVMAEADAVARKAGTEYVTGEHFQEALDRRHKRIAATEDRYREFTLEKLATIDLEGKRVGEAHALSVYSMSDLMFCVPTKATVVASTHGGEGDLIDIMGESDMAGEVYTFGFNEVKGYFEKGFVQGRPVAFRARFVKEESYGGIDGNSSSALNTVVLLSELSEVPIIQRRAMTGGISLKGYVVPIGAETVKVEGFYEACKATGMLEKYDDCGVVIPAKNTIGLQLKPEVVKAIREGKFHVWEVSRIEDAVELMTDVEAGVKPFNPETGKVELSGNKHSVYSKAVKKLKHYTKMARK